MRSEMTNALKIEIFNKKKRLIALKINNKSIMIKNLLMKKNTKRKSLISLLSR